MIGLPWNNLLFDGLRQANDIVIGALHKESLGQQSSLFPDSSAVERSTVNRNVVGSNPTRGAIFFSQNQQDDFIEKIAVHIEKQIYLAKLLPQNAYRDIENQ